MSAHESPVSGPWALMSAHERSRESAHERSWALMMSAHERSFLKSLMKNRKNQVMSAHESWALMWALMSACCSWALMSAQHWWALMVSAHDAWVHSDPLFLYFAPLISISDLLTSSYRLTDLERLFSRDPPISRFLRATFFYSHRSLLIAFVSRMHLHLLLSSLESDRLLNIWYQATQLNEIFRMMYHIDESETYIFWPSHAGQKLYASKSAMWYIIRKSSLTLSWVAWYQILSKRPLPSCLQVVWS